MSFEYWAPHIKIGRSSFVFRSKAKLQASQSSQMRRIRSCIFSKIRLWKRPSFSNIFLSLSFSFFDSRRIVCFKPGCSESRVNKRVVEGSFSFVELRKSLFYSYIDREEEEAPVEHLYLSFSLLGSPESELAGSPLFLGFNRTLYKPSFYLLLE